MWFHASARDILALNGFGTEKELSVYKISSFLCSSLKQKGGGETDMNTKTNTNWKSKQIVERNMHENNKYKQDRKSMWTISQ